MCGAEEEERTKMGTQSHRIAGEEHHPKEEEKTAGDLRVDPAPSKPPQLTIFFNGSVHVFDSISPERAMAIMLIVGATSGAGNVSSPMLTRSPSLQSSTAAAGLPVNSQQQSVPGATNPLCKLHAELPIARRNSLQRFLEKRRDRLVSKNPYSCVKKENPAKDLKSEPSTPLSSCNGPCKSN